MTTIAPPTPDEVCAAVDHWENRLHDLYTSIKSWVATRPDADQIAIFEGSALQRHEPIMDESGVPPRMLPTLAFVKGTKRVAFVPSLLWLKHSNGQVNVTTNEHQMLLHDLGGLDGQPSKWTIFTSLVDPDPRPISKSLVDKLLDKQTLR